MADRTVIQFRCTNEFKTEVERLAKKEDRTVSNYIVNLVNKEIEKESKVKEINSSTDNGEYEPMCPFGYTDCILDRNYIKFNYPEWYKELGSPTKCEGCVNGSDYDDEDK